MSGTCQCLEVQNGARIFKSQKVRREKGAPPKKKLVYSASQPARFGCSTYGWVDIQSELDTYFSSFAHCLARFNIRCIIYINSGYRKTSSSRVSKFFFVLLLLWFLSFVIAISLICWPRWRWPNRGFKWLEICSEDSTQRDCSGNKRLLKGEGIIKLKIIYLFSRLRCFGNVLNKETACNSIVHLLLAYQQ